MIYLKKNDKGAVDSFGDIAALIAETGQENFDLEITDEQWEEANAFAHISENGEIILGLSECQLIEARLVKAKADRAAAVAAITVVVDGMIFDGNEAAQERMARAVLMAESPEEQIEWVLADSSTAMVSAAQLRQACRAAGRTQGVLWVKPYKQAEEVKEELQTEVLTGGTGYSAS